MNLLDCRDLILILALAACRADGDAILPVDTASASGDGAADSDVDDEPAVHLTPPDRSESGYLALLNDYFGVAWTPTSGGAAWGGYDGTAGVPNPYGQWTLTEDAPRTGMLWQQASMCVASPSGVSCWGNVDHTWPDTWPQTGVVTISRFCALFEDGAVRCVNHPDADTASLPPAARLSTDFRRAGCVLELDGTPTCFSLRDDVPAPVLPDVSRRWRDVAISPYMACGTTPSGRVWCRVHDIDEPQQLAGTPPMRDLVVYDGTVCAIDAQNTPRCQTWDLPTHPGVDLPPMTDVTALGLTGAAVCVLREATTLQCWGFGATVERMPSIP